MKRDLVRRIALDPKVMLGKPVIRGTRITVELILEKLAAGHSFDDILEDYPQLSQADIRGALAYARQALSMEEVVPRRAAS